MRIFLLKSFETVSDFPLTFEVKHRSGQTTIIVKSPQTTRVAKLLRILIIEYFLGQNISKWLAQRSNGGGYGKQEPSILW